MGIYSPEVVDKIISRGQGRIDFEPENLEVTWELRIVNTVEDEVEWHLDVWGWYQDDRLESALEVSVEDINLDIGIEKEFYSLIRPIVQEVNEKLLDRMKEFAKKELFKVHGDIFVTYFPDIEDEYVDL